VGAIYDGTGYGPDGSVWGGELLVGGLEQFARVGHLWPVRLPGGDRAVREPWRMACAWLEAVSPGSSEVPSALRSVVDGDRWASVASLCRSGLAAPVTTSAGRLFDAVAALAGLRGLATYEGQAAVELEAACDMRERGAYPMPLVDGVLDARSTVMAVAADAAAGVSPALIATRFHRGFAAATAGACAAAAEANGLSLVVLSGGVFQNRVLLELCSRSLDRRGLRVLVPSALPPNDGGIAYGQAAVAAARMRAGG
jgi:hydrogenase maturation protein HypF